MIIVVDESLVDLVPPMVDTDCPVRLDRLAETE
jgi:hypothetical protein